MIVYDFYLAYKMRGEPEFNFPWSHIVTAAMRKQGFTVCNPAEFDEANGFDTSTPTSESLDVYLAHDLAEVCRSKGIALGKNWRLSQGACTEALVAASLGKRCVEVVEHYGSCRDDTELSVGLKPLDPAVVMGLAYQTLLPIVATAPVAA